MSTRSVAAQPLSVPLTRPPDDQLNAPKDSVVDDSDDGSVTADPTPCEESLPADGQDDEPWKLVMPFLATSTACQRWKCGTTDTGPCWIRVGDPGLLSISIWESGTVLSFKADVGRFLSPQNALVATNGLLQAAQNWAFDMRSPSKSGQSWLVGRTQTRSWGTETA